MPVLRKRKGRGTGGSPKGRGKGGSPRKGKAKAKPVRKGDRCSLRAKGIKAPDIDYLANPESAARIYARVHGKKTCNVNNFVDSDPEEIAPTYHSMKGSHVPTPSVGGNGITTDGPTVGPTTAPTGISTVGPTVGPTAAPAPAPTGASLHCWTHRCSNWTH